MHTNLTIGPLPPVDQIATEKAQDQCPVVDASQPGCSTDDTDQFASAQAQHEMFFVGATDGGVARFAFPETSEMSKYPKGSTVTTLTSTLEIKRWWLFNEWNPVCQFSKYFKSDFSCQDDLHPESGFNNIELIQSVFHRVRGQYSLWGSSKESAKWKKVVVENLELAWVRQNVEVLYPKDKKFAVSKLNGLVLWKDPVHRKYQLLEGNHRVSAWLMSQQPPSIRSIIFIGKPGAKS